MPPITGKPTSAGAALGQHQADFEGLLEAAPDAMVGVDRAGVIRFVNRQTETLFGYDPGALIGRLIETLVPESFRAIHQGLRESYAAAPKTRALGHELELHGRRWDGSGFPVDISLSHTGTGDDLLVIAAVRDMTARNEAEAARRQSDRMSAVIEFSGEAIISTAPDGSITSWNPAAERLYGYTRAEVIGKPIRLLVPEGLADESAAIQTKLLAGRHVENLETVRVRKDGTQIPVLLTISPICDKDGAVVGASAVARDVTAEKQAAQNARSLAEAEDLVRTMMASAAIGIALADLDGRFRVVNQSLRDLVGYEEAWFKAHRVRDMVHPDDLGDVLRRRARVLAGSSDTAKVRLVRADGTTVWARRVSVLIRDVDGEPNLLMVQVEDITAEHEAHEALAHQAIHDPLTGLHNRAWILDILAVDLRAAKRAGTSVGTMFVDLDNFKIVNDSLGHSAGDEVIATVAARIVAALRPGDRVGRFGGDSFVIVVQDVRDVLDVERFAERVSA